MKRLAVIGRWVALGVGIAALHFALFFASIMAHLVAMAPITWLGRLVASLFGPLGFPLVLVLRSPLNQGQFEFMSGGFFALTVSNSLLWGTGVTLSIRWIATRWGGAVRLRRESSRWS